MLLVQRGKSIGLRWQSSTLVNKTGAAEITSLIRSLNMDLRREPEVEHLDCGERWRPAVHESAGAIAMRSPGRPVLHRPSTSSLEGSARGFRSRATRATSLRRRSDSFPRTARSSRLLMKPYECPPSVPANSRSMMRIRAHVLRRRRPPLSSPLPARRLQLHVPAGTRDPVRWHVEFLRPQPFLKISRRR